MAARPELDLVVVGAGIIGLATARELLLRDPRLRIAVVDKEAEVARHQTGHNSGVIHTGVYYQPGSLKAKLCREGMAALYELCERRGVNARRVGKLIVASTRAQLPALEALHARATANGVAVRRLDDPEEVAAIEPHVAAVAALHVPESGIVDFAAVARALADELRSAGAEIRLGFEVTRAARRGSDGVELASPAESLRARRAIFCAGLQSDRLARLLGAERSPRIVPFRGSYLRLAPSKGHLCRGLIYPVPNPELPFLGVHLTRHIGGDVLIGPTALLSGAREHYGQRNRIAPRDLAETLGELGSWRMMRRFWRAGASELHMALRRAALVSAAARLVPALEPGDVLDGPVGVRAQAIARDGRLLDDFAFSHSDGVLHVRNAPSPGATSSLAIAKAIADRALAQLA